MTVLGVCSTLWLNGCGKTDQGNPPPGNQIITITATSSGYSSQTPVTLTISN